MKSPLKIGVVFGLGTMFGILMSRGGRFHCHKAAMLGHHPSRRCHKKAPTNEVAEGGDAEATLLNNNNNKA